ncbi:MAG TPA: arginine--tRNA ligase [Planctomycetes bacterium]|nr:arginine--tRNA ligase [Planctomycetota bacterium]
MAAAAGRSDCAAIVRLSTDPKFGDYQANGVMALAKKIKTNPRKLAEQVVSNLDIADICEPPEIAGPGFINLRLKSDFITGRLLQINADVENRLGIEKEAQPRTIVVDFSCPNIAKQMHVGHLRSTVIGDCICRMLEFLGHNVIRQNHIGDWGLQMGMVVQAIETACFNLTSNDKYLLSLLSENPQKWENESLKRIDLNLEQLESLYIKTNKALEIGHPDFEERIRRLLVGLQHGETGCLIFWSKARDITLKECQRMYNLLNVTLTGKDIRGESFYKDDLHEVVDKLLKSKIAEKSEGAVCVFPDGFKNKEGQRLPFIVQKSDSAYLYATTDLAAIRYRINELKADKIVYVTDARQKLHFEMLFATARMAKWVGDDIELSHVMFGSVLGDDGAPLKTRSGENVKLKELLDEAVERAKAVVEEKNPNLPADKKQKIAEAVGIGAVKYADYSNNRTSDYVFSFDKMLAMDGNTAPYMQYAYARIKSIERKAQTKDVDIATELAGLERLDLTELAELELAKYLIRYGEAIDAAVSDYRPNYLTAYLYELAQKFSAFYTNCPVLDAGPDKRPTRLLLCDLTARTIKHGLSELLGIEVVEQM